MKERLDELLNRIHHGPLSRNKTPDEKEFMEKCRDLRRKNLELYKQYVRRYYEIKNSKYQ